MFLTMTKSQPFQSLDSRKGHRDKKVTNVRNLTLSGNSKNTRRSTRIKEGFLGFQAKLL